MVALTADSLFLYAATYTQPANIVKIRQADMALASTVVMEQPWGIDVSSITAGWSHVYVGTDSNPGQLVKFTGAAAGGRTSWR